jgi:AbrB family looped-hinge helix DNA binding protein
MRYETTITSKGTITIASPIRKALGLKAGQKVRLSIDKNRKVMIDPGTSFEDFEAVRERLVAKIPKEKLGLTGRALKAAIAEAWVEDHK